MYVYTDLRRYVFFFFNLCNIKLENRIICI